MKQAYPIVIAKEHEDGLYLVTVPDFDHMTQGDSIVNAIEMGEDLIALMGIAMEDKGEMIPKPSNLQDIARTYPDEIVTLVTVDFSAYRRTMEQRTVRKNVSIPSYLNEAAEKAGVNFSQLLQRAIKETLNMQ